MYPDPEVVFHDEQTTKRKPIYEIENAFISSGRLWGNIKDHPNCTNGNLQMTSLIESVNNSIVETENSIYKVMSWRPTQSLKSAHELAF